MTIADSQLKQTILREVRKQYGLSIHPDASQFLVDSFNNNNVRTQTDIREAITTIFDIVLKDNADVDIIGKQAVKQVVESLTSVQSETQRGGSATSVTAQEAIKVIDAFSIPKYVYEKSKFVLATEYNSLETQSQSVFGAAQDKANLFKDRYNLVKQHLMRSDTFKSSMFKENQLKITPIKNLVGCFGQRFLIFGMLSRLHDGNIYIEDPDADIRLDLSDINIGVGIYTETCLVLVLGIYESENLFKVEEMCMPPPECRTDTMISHSLTDFFGAPSSSIDEHLLKILEADENQMIVILSDVWLDQSRVLEKLAKMFEGFIGNGVVPVAFIMMGDFVSDPVTKDGIIMQKYRDIFRDFANLVSDYPSIASTSHFIMVPGPADPWSNYLLPRPGLPKSFTETVKSKIKHLVFTTNPCRIRYCTQDIIVFRQDLLAKLHRNAIIKANIEAESSLAKHMVNTIISQGFLCPLPIQVSPMFWPYAHALHVYPLPNLMVIGDRQEPFEVNEFDCECVNPGAFTTTDFQFHVYFPALKKCEQSQV